MSIIRAKKDTDSTKPFGAMNILIIADLHQFPPIGNVNKALFASRPPNQRCELGRHLFEQFQTVIRLRHQVRITDQEWNDILLRARDGECTAQDLRNIRSLVITNDACQVPDFNVPPWNDAVLITPRNSVRTRWNTLSVIKHCKYSGNLLYIAPAEDSTKNTPLSMKQRLATTKLSLDKTQHLPVEVQLAVGMKVMITENVAPHANIANGSRGTIVDILLDPRENPNNHSTTDGKIYLQYPPSIVIIRLNYTDIQRLPELQQNEVPLQPSVHQFLISSKPRCTVTRRQLPLTPGYAFTDIKAQGQTIDHVIVDIGKTTSFGLSPTNAYVALSRSRGRESIRLLRDFENNLFTRHPSHDLKLEDARLDVLAKMTEEHFFLGKYGSVQVCMFFLLMS
jgi:hypothetical protein